MNVLQKIGAFIGQAYKSLFDIIDAHKEDKNNPHDVDKNDVGLGRVDNTSDAEKPLSEAQQEAIGALNGAITSHIGDETIHFEMSDVDSSVDSKIENHDSSNVAHQDIRNEMQNIKEGAIPVKNSEYAEKLGTEINHYTKTTLDAKINKHIKNVVYNPVNAIFTFTFEDGTTTVIDTPVEGTVKDGRFDSATNELVLVLVSEQEIRIPAAGLVKVYSGKETTTTQTSVSSGGEISVDLKQGSIDTVHLSESLLAAINDHLTKTGDTKDNVVSFEEAAEGANIVSGEKLSVIFGKIKKWFSKNNDKLDNLASNPNFTYATKKELLAQGAIIIPVDFTVTDRDILDDIEQLVQPLIDDGSFWKKPVFANYIWKTSYTEGVVAEDRSVLIPATSFQGNSIIGYEFLSDIEVIDAYADVPAACKYTLSVYIRGSSVNARLENRIYKTDKTIFLVEDGDNIVVSSDRDSGMSVFSSAWTEFYTALKNKLTPTIYLKTNNTDVFIPASYYLTKDSYDGVIRIEYVKDGQLWIEDRKFVLDSGGGMGGHGSIISETTVQKIPIGKEFNSLILNLDLMTVEEGLNTQAFKDDISNQFDAFGGGDLPIVIRLKAQGKADVFGSVDKCLYQQVGDHRGVAIHFSIKDIELSGKLKGNYFELGIIIFSSEEGQNEYVTIACRGFKYSNVFFLCDDNDGFISLTDYNSAIGIQSRWGDFHESLKAGLFPSVYLKSLDSEEFYPAAYHFTPRLDDPNLLEGNIRISYIKDNQVCVEDRKFSQLGESAVYDLTIQKIPIGDNPVYVLNITTAGMVVRNPEIMNDFMPAYTGGKSPVLFLRFDNLGYAYPIYAYKQSGGVTIEYDASSLGSHTVNGSVDETLLYKYILDVRKQGDMWNCVITEKALQLNDWDYMKASNIHIVTEYPTNLSAYPDGSIFIKTVS